MNTKQAGLAVALAALLVNAPRLMLIYLRVDGLALPAGAEGTMLAVTGIATGIVLTGGGMYIAHVLASPRTASGWMRATLILVWLALLAFAVVLISPALVSGIQSTDLKNVLNTGGWQWAWSIIAVAAVEILAAGAMVAHAIESASEAGPATSQQSRRSSSRPSPLSVVANAAAQRLAASIQPAQQARTEPQREPALQAIAEPTQSRNGAGSVHCRHAERGCNYIGSQAGENAHQQWCKFSQEGVGQGGGKP